MKIGFILPSMTHLRYFLPLVEEAKKSSISSVFFIDKCTGKYNSVRIKRNLEDISYFSNLYEIELADYSFLKDFKGTVFQIEGDGWRGKKNKNRSI